MLSFGKRGRFVFLSAATVMLLAVILGYPLLDATATVPASSSPTEQFAGQLYEQILENYQDWAFDQLQDHLQLGNDDEIQLSFDPRSATYYDEISDKLKMTEAEQRKFKTYGFVAVDAQRRHSFGSAYYQIYSSDLPVLVTTDSVLGAWHHSYDRLLSEVEQFSLEPALVTMLEECHQQLAALAVTQHEELIQTTCRDVDLYLTIARNLLAGAGGPRWKGELDVPSVLSADEEALARLADVKSLRLQNRGDDTTPIYGGNRWIDYSQFQPRGHYTRSSRLESYFRCMMWLGRADCGFHVLPPDPIAGPPVDWRRELVPLRY